MKKIFKIFKMSFREFSSTKNLVLCGLMAGLGIVLGFITRFNIGPYIRVEFPAIPSRIVDSTFGPVVGSVFGGLLDVLKFIVRPDGTFFPGFTISGILAGLIYGIILYNRPIKIGRILVAEIIEKIFIDCLLNTYWLSILYGTPFWTNLIVQGRLVTKLLIQLPIDVVVVYFSLKAMQKILEQLKFKKSK